MQWVKIADYWPLVLGKSNGKGIPKDYLCLLLTSWWSLEGQGRQCTVTVHVYACGFGFPCTQVLALAWNVECQGWGWGRGSSASFCSCKSSAVVCLNPGNSCFHLGVKDHGDSQRLQPWGMEDLPVEERLEVRIRRWLPNKACAWWIRLVRNPLQTVPRHWLWGSRQLARKIVASCDLWRETKHE